MSPVKVTVKLVRRVVLGIAGTVVLLLGIVMLVAPGPAFVMIPLGLAILGLEFRWAKSWLRKVRQKISAYNAARRNRRAAEHRQRTGAVDFE